MGRFVLLLGLCVIAGPAATTAQQTISPRDIAIGRDLAFGVCAACHVVAPDQRFAPVLRPPAPDFLGIANRPNTTAASLTAFLKSTHNELATTSSMPNPELTDDETTHVVAFMMSLRGRHLAPTRPTSSSAMPSAIPSRAGDPAAGRKLAVDLCTRCHVIERNGAGGWTDAPSFPAIAERPGATAQSLAAIISKPHVSMLNLDRNPTESADLAAFILSLRWQ